MHEHKIVTSSLFKSSLQLIHGVSTFGWGDMKRNAINQKKFLSSLKLPHVLLTSAEQVHGSKIANVKIGDKGKQVPGVDGLICKVHSGTQDTILGVFGADCSLLMFADVKSRVFGVAHAGWKGTIGEIAPNMIKKMIHLGSKTDDVMVFIGPRIGVCCYNIDENRAAQFEDLNTTHGDVLIRKNNHVFLDMGKAILYQLKKSGIKGRNIDIYQGCTSCQKGLFFSYRGMQERPIPEIMGVLSMGDL